MSTLPPDSSLPSSPATPEGASSGAPSNTASKAAPVAITEHDALPAGTRFGEFEIVRVLGVGGFGIVYLARDHSLEREVALKEYMPASLAARGLGPLITVRSSSFVETYAIGLRSFVNEARLLARFDHPSLVKVYRFWEDNATAYMVMPYLVGITLRDTRRAMPHPPDEPWIRSVIAPILGALELLHREGVFHRDIAPDNILIPREGPPVLLDFGAARRVISDRTQSLTAILKPNYAPIEQYADMSQMRQGPWTDLYALGAVIHFLLFGMPPAPATSRAVQDDAEPVGSRQVPGVSTRFLEVVEWMLALRPNHRPQSVDALRAVLDGRVPVPLQPRTLTQMEPALPSGLAAAMQVPSLDAAAQNAKTEVSVPDRAGAVSELQRASKVVAASVLPGTPTDQGSATVTVSRSRRGLWFAAAGLGVVALVSAFGYVASQRGPQMAVAGAATHAVGTATASSAAVPMMPVAAASPTTPQQTPTAAPMPSPPAAATSIVAALPSPADSASSQPRNAALPSRNPTPAAVKSTVTLARASAANRGTPSEADGEPRVEASRSHLDARAVPRAGDADAPFEPIGASRTPDSAQAGAAERARTYGIPQPLALSARDACGKRVFIAMALCLEERCEEPRYRNGQECVKILDVKRARENR